MTEQEAKEIVDALARSSDTLTELEDARKQVADAEANRLILESMLVDALGALQFYAREFHWMPRSSAYANPVLDDSGKRARVTLNRIFERGDAFSKVQALRDPLQQRVLQDGTHGCDTCEEGPR